MSLVSRLRCCHVSYCLRDYAGFSGFPSHHFRPLFIYCLSLRLFIYLFLCLSVCGSISLSFSLSLFLFSLFLSFSLSLFPTFSLSLFLSVSLPILSLSHTHTHAHMHTCTQSLSPFDCLRTVPDHFLNCFSHVWVCNTNDSDCSFADWHHER